MSDNQLKSLQDKVLKLLAMNRELIEEIESMKTDRATWQNERSRLLKQNDAARRRVNEMIKQLQVLERNSGQ